MLATFTAYVTAAGAALALILLAWKGLRNLSRFIDAVTANTTAVASLGNDLRAHTIATTTALTALDQRVTRLESTP